MRGRNKRPEGFPRIYQQTPPIAKTKAIRIAMGAINLWESMIHLSCSNRFQNESYYFYRMCAILR